MEKLRIKTTDPAEHLKYGSADLLLANNYKWKSTICFATGNLLTYGAYYYSIKHNPNEVAVGATFIGIGLGMAGVYYGISGLVHERRAAKRIYWGMNGITIPLNQ